MRLNLLSGRTLPRFAPIRRALETLASVGFACLLISGTAAATAQTAGSSAESRVTLETLAPHALANATDAGPLPASQPMTLTLTLTPTTDRASALKDFLTQLTTASSPNYRKWITPAQFAASYGATAEQIASATAWVQSQGLAVESVSSAGTRMTVTGFPEQVQSAFAVTVHQVQVGGFAYFANLSQPSLPTAVSGLFNSIEGLDNLPADTRTLGAGPKAASGTTINGTASDLSIATLGKLIDENASAILTINATKGTGTPSASQIAGYTALFRQASAQGITTLLTRTAASGGFPSGLAEVTAVANPGDTADLQTPFAVRPDWQSAQGLPADNLRHAPDLTASSVSALASTLSSIALPMPQGRLGNINPVLYELAPTKNLYSQPDDAAAGTWEAPTGLGVVDLATLAKAFPKGTGKSYTSISLSSYSTNYGTPITFTSNVTSGTGGAVPSGTLSFILGNGSILATVQVVSGVASYTSTPNLLDAGTLSVEATYSGDSTYAGSQSPTAQVYIAPEKSILTAVGSNGATLGGTYSVAVTDTGSGNIGQPTGTVTLQVQGTSTSLTQTLSPATSTSSSTIFNVPANTVGTLTLSINCATTTDFTCYTPYTTTVTVAKATPTMAISYSPTQPVSGQTITLLATVTGVGSAPTPTGSVTFYDNTTVLNSANLVNGSVTETATVPNTTTHKITATYNGDPNYNPVSANGSNSSGGTTATSTALSTSASTVTGGQSFTLSVKVTPQAIVNNAQPTGLVQIQDGGVVIATTPALSNGSVSYTLSLTTAGTHNLTAYYVGDANYAASTSPSVPITVTSSSGLATTTLVTSSSYAVTYGTPFTLTAAVSPVASNNTTPTGNITFSVGGVSLATVALSGGKASYQLTAAQLPNAGSYTYTASYSGDTTFASSSAATSSVVTVSAATAVITATINPPTVGTGASTTVSATVTLPNSIVAPTGTVVVTVPNVSGAVYSNTLSVVGANAGGTNIAVNAPPAGTYTLAVTCSANANYTCNSTTVGLTSTASTGVTTTTTVSANSYAITAGQSVTLTAAVSPSSIVNGVVPTGTVTFTSTAQGVIASNIPLVNGVATFTSSTLAAGSYTIVANYSGDANYAPSTGTAPSTLVVSPASTGTTAALSASLSASTVAAGGTLTVSATVTLTGSSTPPTGTVLATILLPGGGTSNFAGTLTGGTGNSATTSITVTAPATAGTYTLNVGCASTDSFTCTAVPFTITVTGSTSTLIQTTTVLTISPTAPTSGQQVTLTGTVTAATTGATAISGTVYFYSGSTQIGSGTVTNGVATASVTFTGTSALTLTAVYSGNTVYAPSSSLPVTVALSTVPSSIAITATGTPGLAGSVVTLNAVVTGGAVLSSGASPTGKVSFYVAGTIPQLLGTVTLTSAGPNLASATLYTGAIPAGSVSVYAIYSGDTNFGTSTSNSIVFGISDYSVTFTPPNITLSPGQTGTAVLTVTTTGSFNGTIALGCTPPSNEEITCSLSNTTLNGAGTSTLTINTVASHASLIHDQLRDLKAIGGVSLAALLCWVLPLGKRRRLPGLLLALLAIGLTANLGCTTSTLASGGGGSSGTPLGTVNLTVNTVGSNGTTEINHDYSYQITIQ
jgi:hypothetical protein